MSNLSCGTHVAEPTANIDCRKLLNQSCRFLPKLKLPISADAKLPLTPILVPDRYAQFIHLPNYVVISIQIFPPACDIIQILYNFASE